MKRTVLFTLMLALVASMLSFVVLAVSSVSTPETGDTSMTGTVQIPTQNPDVSVQEPEQVQPTQEPTAIAVSEKDVVINDSVADLNAQFIRQNVFALSNSSVFPIVLDLTVLPETIDSLSAPKEFVDTICTAYLAAQTTEDAVKVITKTHEYSWTFAQMQMLAESPTQTVVMAYQNAKTVAKQQQEEQEEKPVEVPTVSVEFAASDKQKTGILFVAKDANGEWNATNQCLYSSALIPILIVVLMVLVTLALIIAVNLIIIKIYRSLQ